MLQSKQEHKLSREMLVCWLLCTNFVAYHSLISGSLDYKTNTLQNISEIYTKGFNLTIPCNTSMSNLVPRYWRAGIHGWWVIASWHTMFESFQQALSYHLAWILLPLMLHITIILGSVSTAIPLSQNLSPLTCWLQTVPFMEIWVCTQRKWHAQWHRTPLATPHH